MHTLVLLHCQHGSWQTREGDGKWGGGGPGTSTWDIRDLREDIGDGITDGLGSAACNGSLAMLGEGYRVQRTPPAKSRDRRVRSGIDVWKVDNDDEEEEREERTSARTTW